MKGVAYSFLCVACNEPHDPGLTCDQAAIIRGGRCESCGVVHGHLNCEEVRAIFARIFPAQESADRAVSPGRDHPSVAGSRIESS